MNEQAFLTPQQVDFFQTFGYLSLPGLFAPEVAQLQARFDEAFASYPEAIVEKLVDTHYMKLRKILPQLIERTPEWAQLLDDPRVSGVFSSILGEDFIYHGSQGDIFTGDTYWHSDLYDLFAKYQHIKFAMYLDPMGPDSGAFRVMPGSHYLGDRFGKSLGMHKIDNLKRFGIADADMPAVILPTRPGDVLIFDYRLKHATCNSTHPRRMLTISACKAVAEEDLPELGRRTRQVVDVAGCVYLPPLLENAPASRLRHLQQKLASLAVASP